MTVFVPLELTPIIEGKDDGPTIVFIQGWPDDATLWDAAVAALRDDHRCVRMTLPNFDGTRETRWGYDTLEIVDALERLVRHVARGERVVLVLHDWGCYWGHILHHRAPEIVRAIAGLDVAPHYRPTPTAMLFIIAYQWWLFGAFVVGGPVGDAMTRAFAQVAHAPAARSKLTAWMNYPYRNVWADLVTGRARKLTKGYWPTCPLLFVYGEKKPAQFHSKAWIEHVKRAGGEVRPLPCDHWVPRAPELPRLLRRWLASIGA